MLFCLFSLPGYGQSAAVEKPWFGIALPPKFTPHTSPAEIGDRGPAPARVPTGEESYGELAGARLAYDLRRIVEFSRQSRLTRELGGDQLWGRVSGFSSGESVVRWAAEQLRAAGIDDVRLQQFDQQEGSSLWLPERWEVRLLANAVFGAGSADVVLETAMALAPSEIPGDQLTAPIVYVGSGSPAVVSHQR